MKHKTSKLLSILLALVMMAGLLPLGQVAYAASAVTNLRWDGNTARWDTDGSASQYRVVLETDSITLKNDIVDTTSIDYSSYLLPGNTYDFRVAPIVGSEQQDFVTGPSKTIAGERGTITPVTVDVSSRTAAWPSVSGADGYDVWVRKNNAQIGVVRDCNTNSIDFSYDVTQNGSGEYSINVRAYKLHRGNYLAEGKSSAVNIYSYKITVSNDGNGTATASLPTAATGTEITLSSTPNTGYQFKEWQIISGGIHVTDNKFVMGSEDVEIKAIFEDEPELHFTTQPASGTVNNEQDYSFTWATDVSVPSYAQRIIQRYISDTETTNYDIFSTSPATIMWWGGARDTTQKFRLWISYHGKDYYSNDFTVTWGNPSTITYDVTFYSNGHGTAPAAQTVESGNTATKPANPSESGWTFGGWYTEASCENEFDFSTPITTDIDLYAKWTVDPELHFTTPPVSGSVVNNGEDYVFVWATDAYGSYDQCKIQRYVSDSETINQADLISSPATIEWWEGARDTTQRFRLWILYNGKDYYSNDFTVTWTDSVTPTAPTITTSSLPGGKVGKEYNQTLEATGDTPITWEVVGGSSLPAGLTLAADGKISGTPTTAGDYTFSVKATNGAGDATQSYTVTIAPADAVTYTVSFNANSGGGTMADVIVIAGEKLTLPECAFTPPSADKEFDKWDAGKPGDKVDITADCTITAIWKDKTVVPTTYTVTFKDGESTLSTATVNSGEKVTKPADPTKTGYTFNGWYADATFTAAFDFDQPITANTTIYAKFTDNSVTPPGPTTYTVTFKDGESTLSTATVNSGEKVAKPADPTKTGYTFNGWYADATFGVVFDFDQAITANTTVYAKFTKDSDVPPATITYTVTGGGNSTWTKGSSATVTITVKRSEDDANCFNHFTGVEIDGVALAAGDYEAVSGSTVVTLKASALQKLSNGSHTVTVKFDDGKASTGLTVKAASGSTDKPTSPKTGDESNLHLWVILMLMSILGFIATVAVGRKKRQHSR